ncbi:hypothetical protein RCO28_18135 [Streptomyces sp. LHD-70]|uniref:hypothetical protein n=1 Tax=Streptomyces sp. LHD-70 TaxID=3072140 RepID=UPI00280D55D1|nr:hypothetical protein [Streptomyces sp. LHD-70]MDQ8704395.1 hypothetical protein [Streptomyces sp. LHD-70]
MLRRRFRLDTAGDPRPRLALDVLVAAFHWALAEWTARPGSPTRAQLASGLRAAVAAAPDSLTLTVTARD